MPVTGINQNKTNKVMTSAEKLNDAFSSLNNMKSDNATTRLKGIAELGKMIAYLMG